MFFFCFFLSLTRTNFNICICKEHQRDDRLRSQGECHSQQSKYITLTRRSSIIDPFPLFLGPPVSVLCFNYNIVRIYWTWRLNDN